jgi:DNA gyrase subunit B
MPEGRYRSADIEVLEGLEAVRRRPGHYVGSLSEPGTLAKVALEPLCLAIDEHTGGPAKSVRVTLRGDDSAEVENDGPGLPLGGRPGSTQTYVEVILTQLHACRDMKQVEEHEKWCGVGVAVLCALSEWLTVTVKREGGVWVQRFEKGRVASGLDRVGDASETGTSVTFKPDRGILTAPFSVVELGALLGDFAKSVPCVTTSIRDLR